MYSNSKTFMYLSDKMCAASGVILSTNKHGHTYHQQKIEIPGFPSGKRCL